MNRGEITEADGRPPDSRAMGERVLFDLEIALVNGNRKES
jgi:hypothetical protein